MPKKKIKLLLVRNYIRRHQERFVRKEKKKYLQKKKQEKIYLNKKYNDKSENPSRRSNLWQRWLLVKSSLCLCQRSFRKWGEVLKLEVRRPQNLKKISHWFWCLISNVKTSGRFFSNFCGLFRKPELYKKKHKICMHYYVIVISNTKKFVFCGIHSTFFQFWKLFAIYWVLVPVFEKWWIQPKWFLLLWYKFLVLPKKYIIHIQYT